MPDPVTPSFGYRQRPIRLTDTELKLDLMFMQGLPDGHCRSISDRW